MRNQYDALNYVVKTTTDAINANRDDPLKTDQALARMESTYLMHPLVFGSEAGDHFINREHGNNLSRGVRFINQAYTDVIADNSKDLISKTYHHINPNLLYYVQKGDTKPNQRSIGTWFNHTELCYPTYHQAMHLIDSIADQKATLFPETFAVK